MNVMRAEWKAVWRLGGGSGSEQRGPLGGNLFHPLQVQLPCWSATTSMRHAHVHSSGVSVRAVFRLARVCLSASMWLPGTQGGEDLQEAGRGGD